jgi:beta-galactosidase
MGGFPWWLLKDADIHLRTRDPRYIAAAKRYLKEVGRVLNPLQVTRGGPILMVQVENEYGFFGKDAAYMGEIRQALLDAGFDVPLFACNPPEHLKDGFRSDLFPVANFGSDPAKAFKTLREILPKGPLMCGEFYPGWFDTWGAPHHTGNTAHYLTDLEYMLKTGASFSIYMVHGGTSFGFWTGADRPFKPDTSSYDYDAPISEAGWPTEKFFKNRELFQRYLLPGETIPVPGATNPVMAFPPLEAKECAPLLENLPAGIRDTKPRTMEQYDQGYGCILYRTTLPAGPEATLEAGSVHDIGQVFVDGRRVGIMDRRNNKFSVRLPRRQASATLDVLVEAMGRVNFGAEVNDAKGLRAPVTLQTADAPAAELTNWLVFSLPLDDAMRAGLRFGSPTPHTPAFWRTSFNVTEPHDTFLDLRNWSKGFVWVNGHNLGRFWNIGPQQTMYLPGPWLKPGKNEILVLDLFGPEKAVIAGLEQPILNQVRPELDFASETRN